MSTAELQFRSATFGGFHRQDVLTYLDNVLAEHTRQTEDLQTRLRKSERQGLDYSAELAEVRAKAEHLEEENAGLSALLADVQQELNQARGELEQTRQTLGDRDARGENAEAELRLLRERLGKLEEDAAAFSRIRERAGTIELEAHMRAQTLVDEAQTAARDIVARAREQARDLLERTEAETAQAREGTLLWLGRVREDYDRVRTDLESTVYHVVGELGRVQETLGAAAGRFALHEDALEQLTGSQDRDEAAVEAESAERAEQEAGALS